MRVFVLPLASRFPLGQLVVTAGVQVLIVQDKLDPVFYLNRHLKGDWGEVGEEDAFENDMALEHGGRVLSAYTITPTQKLWIITESDRSVTTLLLPEEY
jgi:hypothetical protein